MELQTAVAALAGLGHETRLRVFRMLVERGPEGLPAGKISQRLELPPTTLSFHLAHLETCRLITSRRDGRMIIYSANFAVMDRLMAYLTENCCGEGDDTSCVPAGNQSPSSRKPRVKKEPVP